MGIIQQGSLLDWRETKKYAGHVRTVGTKQFINLYHKVKDRRAEAFRWGDEIEHILIKLDDEEKTARVWPKNVEILSQVKSISARECRDNYGSNWMPEHGAFQLESTPGRPFDSTFSTFSIVESNMGLRRQQVNSVLDPNNGEKCLTMTHLPRFGCRNCFVLPNEPIHSELTKSLSYPDVTVSQFGRYKALEVNVRERRGEHVSIKVPVYKDEETNSAFWSQHLLHQNDDTDDGIKDGNIKAECTVAAASCSCLQVTFQTHEVSQAKYLYDQLIPMCPIMLALSASTPIFRGYLSDVDCRWNAISASVDARNRGERGVEPLKDSEIKIPKRQFGTPSFYLLSDNQFLNDIAAPYDTETFHQLVKGGVEEHLARHFAHIFIHDPLILYKEDIPQDEKNTGLFQKMCSTNWSSVKLKPPLLDIDMGWRIEFRTLEVQLTDFENAAYATFIMLLVRAIDKFKLDLTVPISKVDINMEEAQRRDAVREKTFFFKENVGAGAEFPGLIPLIKRYIMTEEDADDTTIATVSGYLQLISDRASGRVNTIAKWIRDFVAAHPDYKRDSVISERINYDLVKLLVDISDGKVNPQHLNAS